jgi:hypothetical protein
MRVLAVLYQTYVYFGQPAAVYERLRVRLLDGVPNTAGEFAFAEGVEKAVSKSVTLG